MTFPRRQILRLAAGVAALVPAPRIGSPPPDPPRPVRVIVPFAPGGPTDVFARLMAQKLSEQMGAQFYVENIVGAGGNIGAGRAAQSTPDGYTLLVNGANHVVNPALYQRVPYDPTKDFDPVTMAVTAPAVLTVNPTLPVDTVRDLVALIRAHPGKYSYASPGVGTPPHLVGELFRLSLGLDLVHVPFNGGGPAIGSAVGPHTDFLRLDGAGGAAGQRREAAGARGLDQDALAGAARRPHHDGGRLFRRCGRIVVRRPRAGWNAEGHYRAAAAGDCTSHRRGGHEGTAGHPRLRVGRQHARGVRCPIPGGNSEMGESHWRGGHQGAVTAAPICVRCAGHVPHVHANAERRWLGLRVTDAADEKAAETKSRRLPVRRGSRPS